MGKKETTSSGIKFWSFNCFFLEQDLSEKNVKFDKR